MNIITGTSKYQDLTTVGDLIKLLQAYDPSLPVSGFFRDHCGDLEDASEISISPGVYSHFTGERTPNLLIRLH